MSHPANVLVYNGVIFAARLYIFIIRILLCVLCSLAMPSLNYERLCLLFNIGVLQGQIAAAQNFQSDEGLKTAAKMFQVRLSFSKAVQKGKLKGVQCSETVKSGVSSI